MVREACRVADLLLVPYRPRTFDLNAARTTADLVKAARKPVFVVFVAGPPKAAVLYGEAADVIREVGLLVAPVMLAERGDYHHSTGSGLTAQEHAPGGKAALEVAAFWAWTKQQVKWSTKKLAETPTIQPKRGIA